jgi:hypothetical protein
MIAPVALSTSAGSLYALRIRLCQFGPATTVSEFPNARVQRPPAGALKRALYRSRPLQRVVSYHAHQLNTLR